MILYRVAHLDCTNGAWTKFNPPEPFEHYDSALEKRVERQQVEHRKRVESVKNGLQQLAEAKRMPG